MPESTSPAPLPAPDAGGNNASNNAGDSPAKKQKRRSPSALNQAQEKALCKAGQIATAAAKPAYAGILADREIPASFVATLAADIKTTSDKSRAAVSCDAAKQGATRDEASTGEALVGSIRVIQAAARQKYLPEQPDKLGPYGIGERIDESRPALESFSEIIIDTANDERPPGINTEFLILAEGERDAYISANGTQSTEGANAKQARADRNAMLKSITQRRMKIQRAIDGKFPPDKTSSAGPRKEFQLPASRPFSF